MPKLKNTVRSFRMGSGMGIQNHSRLEQIVSTRRAFLAKAVLAICTALMGTRPLIPKKRLLLCHECSITVFSPSVAKSQNPGTARRPNYQKVQGIEMATFVQSHLRFGTQELTFPSEMA